MNINEDFSVLYEKIKVKNGNKYGKLKILPGKATPAPPITPCLGQRAIDIRSFCKTFNDKSGSFKDKNLSLKTSFSVNSDKSLNLVIHGPSMTDLIMSHFNISKGASKIGHEYIGNITQSDADKISMDVLKYNFSNTKNVVSIANNVISVAKSMGMKFTNE